MEYVEGVTLADELKTGPLASATWPRSWRTSPAPSTRTPRHRPPRRQARQRAPAQQGRSGQAGRPRDRDGRREHPITMSGTVLGTAAYMAPEQLEGDEVGPAADVYSLAAVAFEALSGRKAREGSTPMEVAHRVVNEPAPDLRDAWPDAPKEAARVLQRGMAREPEDRPESCRRVRSRALRGARGDSLSRRRARPGSLGADRRSARPRLRREAPHPHSLRQPRPTPHLKPMLLRRPTEGSRQPPRRERPVRLPHPRRAPQRHALERAATAVPELPHRARPLRVGSDHA